MSITKLKRHFRVSLSNYEKIQNSEAKIQTLCQGELVEPGVIQIKASMSTTSGNNWYKIAESIAEIPFAETGLAELEVNGRKICLVNHQEKLYACSDKCPHAGGNLAQGYLDAIGNIVCPLHRYRFDLQSGRNTSGEGFFLKTFPIEERENGIFVCLGPATVL
jgi:nitrite reductase/ring-hydroxylating ferredoxin subunit